MWGARGIPSTYSGYETFLTAFLPHLVEKGHEVTVYCRKGQVPELDSYSGVDLVHLPAPTSKQLGTLSHGLLASCRARLARHDVVFVVNVANSLYCLLARISGQRTILNTDGQEWLRGKWGSAARWFFKSSAQISRFGSGALIADCVAMRDVYRSEFHVDSTVIPYPWTELTPTSHEDVLGSLELAPRGYYLAAGRLNPENNIQRIARAYVESGLERPLVLLGAANYDSPVERELREFQRAHSTIRLVGHVSNRSSFTTLLSEARGYIHGHSVGGLNPSLVEAMGSGALVLALGTIFNREAVGDAGLVFSDFGADFREKLQTIEEKDLSDYRRRARERAASLFKMDDVVAAHDELFRVVARSGVWDRIVVRTPWLSDLTAPEK